MRERGSNTARTTEKGGGGLPIRSRFGRFGRFRRVDSVDSVDFGASIRSISSRFADFLLPFRADTLSVSSRFADFLVPFRADTQADTLGRHPSRHPSRNPSRHPVGFVAICRFPFAVSCRHPSRHHRETPKPTPKTRRKHKKSPIPSIGESGCMAARCRALLTFC